MFIIAFLFVLFVFVSSLIMPWVNRSNISELRDQIDWLNKEVLRLSNGTPQSTQKAAAEERLVAAETSQPPHEDIRKPTTAPTDDFDPFGDVNAPIPIIPKKATTEPGSSLEQQFGGKAFVWLGGIALALAGFYMVKYSIESGLLTERVRVALGLIFGAALLIGSSILRQYPHVADGKRISQALAGAGIADLYGCFFAATSLYHLVPPFFGFACMAGVTALALVLSLRHGAPIALMGLLGGFATPALLHGDANTPLLFGYLYLVFGGLSAVIRRQNWWWMSIPTTILGFLWVGFWLISGMGTDDAIWLSLFLFGVCATVVASTRGTQEEMQGFKHLSWWRYLTLGCSALLLGCITSISDYGALEWDMFGLFSLAAIVLAWFDCRTYRFAPWIAMGTNIAMLLGWNEPSAATLAITIGVFGVLFTTSGVLLQWRSNKSVVWACMTAAASLAYYLLGYYGLRSSSLVNDIPLFWGLLALTLSGSSLIMLHHLMRTVPDRNPQRQYFLAIYTALATAFLSIGLTIELKHEFLSVAIASEMLVLAWLNTRFDIKALRWLVGTLAIVFGILLVPQILLLVQVAAYSLVEARLPLQNSIPIVNWPLFQLGLPAVFFIGSSYLFRSERDDALVNTLEASAIALIGIMGYYLTRHAFHIDENILFIKAGFIERNAITNILFAYALACLWCGRAYARPTLVNGGIVLAGVALFRLGYFEFIAYNPLWSMQAVGSMPIVNGLLLAYGLPIGWMALAMREWPALQHPTGKRLGNGLILLLAFTLVSLNVRQFYHGSHLSDGLTSNAEVYTYSAVWLLMGTGLLIAGTARKDRMMRITSLGIMLLTVGKVFLYDASELTGLWRVFSFFGLGLSLLGLSWFYSRFVFNIPKKK